MWFLDVGRVTLFIGGCGCGDPLPDVLKCGFCYDDSLPDVNGNYYYLPLLVM